MLFHARQHVWATYLHKPAIVLNIISEDMCQIDTGNGPILTHMSDLQPFHTAYDMNGGVSSRPADNQSYMDFFDKIDKEYELRAAAAKFRPDIKLKG